MGIEFDYFIIYAKTYSNGWVKMLKTNDLRSILSCIEALNPNECEKYKIEGHYNNQNYPYFQGQIRGNTSCTLTK